MELCLISRLQKFPPSGPRKVLGLTNYQASHAPQTRCEFAADVDVVFKITHYSACVEDVEFGLREMLFFLPHSFLQKSMAPAVHID